MYLHPDTTRFALACVADGHGSDRCPYSDEGAKTAVTIAADILAELLDSPNPAGLFTAQKDIRLPRLLETRWKETVRIIHSTKVDPLPFSFELYGTTLLALAATKDFVFALQIGDGDAVAIDPDGSARWLIPAIDQAGNETESLCLENAWQFVRTQFIPTTGENDAPLMFLLSTDGYANSFTSNEGFLKVGADIFRLLRENGRDYIEKNLPQWLEKTSEDGSGDDISVAIINTVG